MFIKALTFLSFVTIMLFGCSSSPQIINQSSRATDQSSQEPQQEIKTTRLHIDGFVKSKSGAI